MNTKGKIPEERYSLYKLVTRDADLPTALDDYVRTSGFLTAPASTKYHGNYEGGLFDHTMTMLDELVYMTRRLDLKWQNPRSPYVVSLVHDFTKIDEYIVNPKAGQPGEHPYIHNPDTLLIGHADKSIILAGMFMTLSMEEILCIRYHMGVWTLSEENNCPHFNKVIAKHPNVYYTHVADMLASQVMGI